MGTIWLLSLLPFLLLFSLVFGILLIPILHRLCEEIERVNHGSSEQRSPEYHSTDRRSTVDITLASPVGSDCDSVAEQIFRHAAVTTH